MRFCTMIRHMPQLPNDAAYQRHNLERHNNHLMQEVERLQNTNKELLRYATIHNCEIGKEFGGVDLGCMDCKEGFFRQNGAPQCLQCAEGMGSKAGSAFCTGDQGLPAVSCPHMHYVKGYDATALLGTNCRECDPSRNEYTIGNNIDIKCHTCPSGTTLDNRKLITGNPRQYDRCPEQPVMHQVSNKATVNPCAPCEPGTVEEGGQCIQCPMGQYTDEFGQVACKTCENPNSYAFVNPGGKTCDDSAWHVQQQATGQDTYLSRALHAFNFYNDEGQVSQLSPKKQSHWSRYTVDENSRNCWKSRN